MELDVLSGDQEAPVAAEGRMRKVLRRVWFVSLAILVIGFIVVVVFLASRPHWHTYTGPLLSGWELAITAAYPEDWQPDVSQSGPGVVLLRQKPPTGLSRWWIKTILRQDVDQWKDNRIIIFLRPRGGVIKNIETLERGERSGLFRFHIKSSIRRFRHDLGPALDVTDPSLGN